jgi:hypothetical protein
MMAKDGEARKKTWLWYLIVMRRLVSFPLVGGLFWLLVGILFIGLLFRFLYPVVGFRLMGINL